MHHPIKRLGYFTGIYLAVFVFGWGFAAHAATKSAQLTLIPGRVIVDDKNSYASVVLKNSGDASGDYTVDLIDTRMQESGNIIPTEKGSTAENSLLPYTHISPRSMTLAPGEAKRLQILVRKPSGMQDGEYRSHLKIRLVNDNADNATAVPENTKTISVMVKANLVMITPVILRHGQTAYTMQLESPKLSRDSEGHPELTVYLHREGNRSSLGDITIEYVSPEGKSQQISYLPGVVSYREVSRRGVTIPLEVPGGVDLTKGTLKITYTSSVDEKEKVRAETTLPLS